MIARHFPKSLSLALVWFVTHLARLLSFSLFPLRRLTHRGFSFVQVRFAARKYKLADASLDDQCVHLTNNSINKAHDGAGFSQNWRFQQLLQRLETERGAGTTSVAS